MDELNYLVNMSVIEYTRCFAEAKAPSGKRIGGLTLKVPLRTYRIDKKGRKRHDLYGLDIDLVDGPGALNKKSLISSLKKEFKEGKPTRMTLTPAKLSKLLKVIKEDK